MRLFITSECRFQKDSEGNIVAEGAGEGYSYWSRYLDVFEAVTVIGRLSDSVIPGTKLVEGNNVTFLPIRDYRGPNQYLTSYISIRNSLNEIYDEHAAYIFKVPGHVSTLLYSSIRKRNHPFGLEVAGDPYEVFSSGAVRHPLRPFFRGYFFLLLKQQCKKACATSYVTQHILQKRYPSSGVSIGVSDVELSEDSFLKEPRKFQNKRAYNIVHIGSLEQLYKAPDVQLEAVRTCVENGLDLNLTFIGDGTYRVEMERLSIQLGLRERVHFKGKVASGREIYRELDEADLFLMPSRTEGLPKALIEAMARGLPCIGSSVGGIVELLDSNDMVHPGDSKGLAEKIEEVLSSADRMERMSARNLDESKKYLNSVLQKKRIMFHNIVKNETEKWLLTQGNSRKIN